MEPTPASGFIRLLFLLLCIIPSFARMSEAQPKYTGLWGYCDFQNINTPQSVRTDSSTGRIFTGMTIALDSLYHSAGRITSCGLSTDAGTVWMNQLIMTRALYPSLDCGHAGLTGRPVVADASASEGLRVFAGDAAGWLAPIGGPPSLAGFSLEQGTPTIAAAQDGGIILAACVDEWVSLTSSLMVSRTPDFTTWSPWQQAPVTGVRASTVVSGSGGHVGVVIESAGGLSYWESTDHGITWGDSAQTIVPFPFIVGGDTLANYRTFDLVFQGDEPKVGFTFTRLANATTFTHGQAGLAMWSPSTGVVIAVPHHAIPGVADTLPRAQQHHLTVGYPSIGLAHSALIMVFQAFRPEVSYAGFNYGEIFLTRSTDGGATWTAPENISGTSRLDERYPGVSKWNRDTVVSVVWQEDVEPGSSMEDGAPGSRARQVFLARQIPSSGSVQPPPLPLKFALDQNYPNPFNGETTIGYRIEPARTTQSGGDTGYGERVTLRVYDVLGREVRTLVEDQRPPGLYDIPFDGSNLASGTYLYRLTVGGFTGTKRMVLIR